MVVGFVSLMKVASWGGSEELWSKTALKALSKGYKVVSLTYGWNTESRILALQGAGVETQFYHGDSRRLSDRIAVKLRLAKPKSEQIPQLHADVYVISCGSTWDFVYSHTITDTIMATGKPFYIISHNSLDAGYLLDDKMRPYAENVIKKASAVLFVSERNHKAAERQLARFIPNAQVISNPVNISKVSICSFPESTALLLAFVGTLECDYKGIDLLLEALSGVIWQKRDFQLHLYGKGPQEHYIKELIELYGLQAKVFLRGHVSNTAQIWEATQVLVVSSTSEGVPMVIVEAMLSGRAVISTDVGAASRYVQDGETGFLVSTAKSPYLAEGFERLWQNRANLKQMGEKAFIHARAITNMSAEESLLSIIQAG